MLKRFEIWIGYVWRGQDIPSPTKAERVDVIAATTFENACFIYELRMTLAEVQIAMQHKPTSTDDLRNWYYLRDSNSSYYTGKYYQTEQEAKLSFEEKKDAGTVQENSKGE